MTEALLLQKRAKALALLDDFKEWYMDISRPDGALVYLSLKQDIRRADDVELDRLITEMTDRNMRAMTKKLMQ